MDELSDHPLPPSRPSRLSRSFPWFLAILVVIAGGLLLFYQMRTRLPSVVTIAGGPEQGRYAALAQGLAAELQQRLGLRVDVRTTQGSLENLQLLETHQCDLAFYQPQTRLILEGRETSVNGIEPASFVSNLYPEYLLPIRPVGATRDLLAAEDGVWSCNDRMSGDYAMTRLLLQHLEIDEQSLTIESVNFSELPTKLLKHEVDIGIVCVGLQAPILKTVLSEGVGELLSIPAIDAMARKQTSLVRDRIPAGYFSTSPMVPTEDYETVTVQAQLLADTQAPVRLIEEVTRILGDARFQRYMELTELFSGGIDYATQRPEYGMHPGAQHVYYPDLKPLINPDFVEGTEGLRSFLVSLVAAIWLLHRWWTQRQIRRQEHRLDRYIRELLSMERQQMEVDGVGEAEESKVLQRLLDQVTILRQEALAEFTAHELNEDRAVDCFIQMCHALSDKINAKLIRHSILQSRPADRK
ncbi:MAG: TAXI family TRAP transporter solute-binding subunit [Planctomycetaceae bacterium]